MTLIDKIIQYPRKTIFDSRGWFLKTLTGNEKKISDSVGEIYFTSCEPGYTRGGHYHPKALEWFTIIDGESELHLEDIFTKEQIIIKLSGHSPVTVYVPNNVAHVFINKSDKPFLLCAYSNLKYQAEDTIQYNF